MSGNPIGVYNEWGKLREVMVGIMDEDAVVPPPNYTIVSYMAPHNVKVLEEYQGKVMKDVIPDQHKGSIEQLDGICKVYEKHGIKVHRARRLTEDENNFLGYIQKGWTPMYARDQTFVAGKTVIELYAMMPFRRKDVFAFRDIIMNRVAEDPEAQFISMPMPLPSKVTLEAPEGPGPFLEGGDIFLMGKDIFVGQSGIASNTIGIEWLRRVMALDGFKVHAVPLTSEWLHLDCVLAIVRQGLCMATKSAFKNGLPEYFKDWEVIEATEEEAHHLGVNTMCLEENKVLVGTEFGRIIDELKKHGADVVTTPTHIMSNWGGGMRCSTHPLLRDK